MPGIFIALEGLDGAGKSTQLQLLASWVERLGHRVRVQHFPRYEKGPFGPLIARCLKGNLGSLDQLPPELFALLFALDRHAAAEELRSSLQQGEILLVDRYVLSNAAFQGARIAEEQRRQELAAWLVELEFGHFALPRPDLTLFLDVPAELAARSTLAGKDRDLFEQDVHFQAAVRKLYLTLAANDPAMAIITCSENAVLLPQERIAAAIAEKVRARLEVFYPAE